MASPLASPRSKSDVPFYVALCVLGGSYVLALQSDDAGRQHLRSLKTASL